MYKKFTEKHCCNTLFNLINTSIVMKLFTIVLIVSMHVSVFAFAQRITLNKKNASLSSVIKELKTQSGYNFLYDANALLTAPKVSIQVTEASITEALDECFKGLPLNYVINGHNIIISKRNPPVLLNQTREVTGKVTNSRGEELVSVTVKLKGTNIGTTTDGKGAFHISVPDNNAILVFSNLGYVTKEIAVQSQKTVSVSLQEFMSDLDEVVVVGYGSQKRQDLTGSVSTVNSEAMKDMASSRVDQALAGKVAGVQVSATSGAPGEAVKIRIRGVGSISAGSDPLYVVDGFPMDDIQMINPKDIENIDILKDASATAIYGSRGANGVIFVTTKRGKVGKSVVSIDTYGGWQSVLKRPEFLGVKEQAQYYFDGVKNQNLDAGKDISGDPLKWSFAVPQTIMDVLEGRNNINTDAYDAIFQNAPQQSYNLSSRGGNETVRYSISGEYLNQAGVILSTDFKRYSLRANLDAKVSEKLSFRLNFNAAHTNNNTQITSGGSGGDEGIIGAASTWLRWYPLYNEDGSYFSGFGQDATNNVWNPIAIAKEIKRENTVTRNLGNLAADYQIADHLKLNVIVGATISNAHIASFIPDIPVLNTVADGTDGRSDYLNWLTETTLNYTRSFNKHNFIGLVGYTTQKQVNKSNFLESRSFPNNLVHTLNAASNIIYQGNSNESEWSMISYLSRINYNYDNKYYVTGSVRSDGSSRFGTDKKYGVFPSAALAWRISSESFLSDIQVINDIKLRTSYGATGNNNIGNYSQYANASYESYNFGGVAVGGYAPSQFANPQLTWEKQESFNVGLDGSFLGNRVAVIVDYFKTRNHSLLLNVNVPQITGFTTALQNIGEVQNNGWEFVLNTKNLAGDFSWNTGINFATYKNKVTKLGPEGDPIINSLNITQIGQPIGMFYGYIADGVFMNEGELQAGPIYNPNASDRSRVGDIRFKDISGPDDRPDGIINSYDLTTIGSPYPDFYYGLTNNFEYKNFNLNFTIQGSHGNKVFEASDAFLYTRARYKQLSSVKDYWKSEDQPGDGQSPRPNNNPTGGLRQKSTRFMDTGAFLRVNNINLSYQFNDRIAKSIAMSSLRVYVTATNPILITKYKFFNPEVSNSNNALTPGISNYNYPVAKSYIIGLSASF